ncbi:MAG: hypothetical protein AB1641_05585 [Thermodesulfobacteriota bacterium]
MKARPGLALVDLLAALAVLAVVLSAVYGTFTFQEKTMRAAAEGREVYGQGLVVLDRLVRDLTCAWLPESPDQKAKTVYRFQADQDRLYLATTSVLSSEEGLGPAVVEAGYRWPPRPEGGNCQLLIRRQDDDPDEDPAEGGREIVLTRNLVKLEIRCLGQDGAEQATWRAEQAGRLPRAVRIKLVLAGDDGREVTFLASVSPALALPEVKAPAGLKPEAILSSP